MKVFKITIENYIYAIYAKLAMLETKCPIRNTPIEKKPLCDLSHRGSNDASN